MDEIQPVDIPKKLRFLWEEHRYKVCYGGRGSGKSWGFVRALICQGFRKPTRILCAREVQRSIRDSVHRLISDQISLLGLDAYCKILDQEIRVVNGTEFIFSGLSELTVDSIKSYEGIDIVFIEEGQTITERSWKILIPTIRKAGSEIWVVFNPDLETDPTYQRFISKPAAGTVAVEMNWRDNPFFNDILDAERRDCMERSPHEYDNIWEGKCRPAVEGAIYHHEVAALTEEGRICNVPYDPALLAHVVIDLGFNDTMAIAVVQRRAAEVRIINYIEGKQKTLAEYSRELKELRYNWGLVWLPYSDGFSRDYKTGKGADQIMRELGWDVARKDRVANMSVEDGIRQCRLVFPRIYVDKSCEALIESWKRYRRTIIRQTQTPGSPVHDNYSHGADCTRYIAINVDQMTNDSKSRKMPSVMTYSALDSAVGY